MRAKRKSKPLRKRKSTVRTRKRNADERDPIRSKTLRSTLDPTRTREISETGPEAEPPQTGTSAGDLEGLVTDEDEDFESVAELSNEGQDLEAEEVDAIERTPNADQGELKPRKVPNRTAPGKFSDRNRI
jgi:hypothetical protein